MLWRNNDAPEYLTRTVQRFPDDIAIVYISQFDVEIIHCHILRTVSRSRFEVIGIYMLWKNI